MMLRFLIPRSVNIISMVGRIVIEGLFVSSDSGRSHSKPMYRQRCLWVDVQKI